VTANLLLTCDVTLLNNLRAELIHEINQLLEFLVLFDCILQSSHRNATTSVFRGRMCGRCTGIAMMLTQFAAKAQTFVDVQLFP
jgi:hypothetical protein